MDKVTLDFENNLVIWNTDVQNGTEYCPDLRKRKTQILQAMGYVSENLTPIIRAFEAFTDGQISREELDHQLEALAE